MDKEVKRHRVRIIGTRDEKIEAVRKIKAAMQEHFPEMVELHAQLVELGMCDGTIGDIGMVITPELAYNKYQDNPNHLRDKFRRETFMNEEIRRELHAKTQRKVVAADAVRYGRGSNRRR